MFVNCFRNSMPTMFELVHLTNGFRIYICGIKHLLYVLADSLHEFCEIVHFSNGFGIDVVRRQHFYGLKFQMMSIF